jgi:uncharacterized damage-inducible protein DinB
LTGVERLFLAPPADFASRTVALHLAQLDALTSDLFGTLADVTAEDLQRQHAPGHNTIGMLLAHVAIVEVYWVQVGLLGRDSFDIEAVLGLGMDDDGIPLPPGGAPPAVLAGHDLAWFRDRVDLARRYAYEQLRGLGDAELGAVRSGTRRNGTRREFDGHWVLFHVVEHFAGHSGQILLLRHLQRDARGRP